MKFTTRKLLRELEPFIGAKRFIVAYSGGLDSHVLLASMVELREQLQGAELGALHIHHGVSPDADGWSEHCARVCGQLQVPLRIVRVAVDQTQASLENAFRDARYLAFAENLETDDLLLLAHHADDQAETVLLRLLRGSGAQGGAGMPTSRAIGKAHLLRPLLNFTRQQLQAYAVANRLQWIEDDSNRDQQFDRNFLRHTILPQIADRWPGYRAALCRNALINTQLQQSIDFFLTRELDQLLVAKDRLSIERLQEYETEVQINLLRTWVASLDLPAPSYQQLQQLLDEVVAAREDAQPLVSWPGAWIRRYQHCLYAGTPLAEHDADLVYEWRPDKPITVPGIGTLELKPVKTGVGVSLEKLAPTPDSPITIRFRQGGERCRPAGRQGSHPLKKLLQEYGIPPWLRDRVPLLYVGDELALVGELWVCAGFEASDGQQGYLLEVIQEVSESI